MRIESDEIAQLIRAGIALHDLEDFLDAAENVMQSDETRVDATRPNPARLDSTRRDMTRLDMTGLDATGRDGARRVAT